MVNSTLKARDTLFLLTSDHNARNVSNVVVFSYKQSVFTSVLSKKKSNNNKNIYNNIYFKNYIILMCVKTHTPYMFVSIASTHVCVCMCVCVCV